MTRPKPLAPPVTTPTLPTNEKVPRVGLGGGVPCVDCAGTPSSEAGGGSATEDDAAALAISWGVLWLSDMSTNGDETWTRELVRAWDASCASASPASDDDGERGGDVVAFSSRRSSCVEEDEDRGRLLRDGMSHDGDSGRAKVRRDVHDVLGRRVDRLPHVHDDKASVGWPSVAPALTPCRRPVTAAALPLSW